MFRKTLKRHHDSPFDQLLPFNGGFDRETGKAEIDLAVDISFFGHTAILPKTAMLEQII